MPSLIQQLEQEWACIHYDGGSAEAERDVLRRLSEAREVEDTGLKARRLRTKALDERAAYGRHMDAYGDAIGKSAHRYQRGETTLAASFKREADAALAEATECLKRAEAAEHEADKITANGFVVLFDGVSVKSRAA
jgi:hypothetical protein